jgi:transposase
MASEGATHREIAAAFVVSTAAVAKWRAKWEAGVKTGH